MGSLFKTPKAPAAPDPNAVIAAQQKANFVDENTPYGSVRYTPIGGDRYERNIFFTPLGQDAFNSEQRIDSATNRLAEDRLGAIGRAVSGDLDFSGLPSITTDFS